VDAWVYLVQLGAVSLIEARDTLTPKQYNTLKRNRGVYKIFHQQIVCCSPVVVLYSAVTATVQCGRRSGETQLLQDPRPVPVKLKYTSCVTTCC
jgi:hypothetical protein